MASLLTFLFVILSQTSTVFGRDQLLAHQILPAMFPIAVKSSDIGSPGDNLYSKIAGILDPTIYQDINGKYTFKLIFTRADNSQEQIIEFKQTSWLTDASITGFEPISLPPETVATDAYASSFKGLGLSTVGQCYIDGDAGENNNYYNCVGSTDITNYIPGYDQKNAKEMKLYVVTSGNCSPLDIDSYLTQCSAEFDDLVDDIATNAAGVATNAADISNLAINAAGVATNAADISTNTNDIIHINQVLADLETFNYNAAKVAANNNFVNPASSLNATTSIDYQNYLILLSLLSLLFNAILMSCICIIFKRVNNIGERYQHKKVLSYIESDTEQSSQNK